MRPAASLLRQDQLLNEHAARFSHGSSPATIASVTYGGLQMRQLVAAFDVKAGVPVAVYPVEVVQDDVDEFDDTYAVRLYQQVGGQRRAVVGYSGIPTAASLERPYIDGLPTIAMFANEPDADHVPNCAFRFPTVAPRRSARRGEVLCGYLETARSVPRGESLTWCYGPADVERAYPTSCRERVPAGS